MERVIILCKNGVLDADLLIHLQKRGKTKSSNNPITLEALEKEQIRSILEKTEGNKAKAAELLGIDRSTLYRMIKRHSIEVDGE
jgi:transcriptional regulator of acetoin/glycerol metabolism